MDAKNVNAANYTVGSGHLGYEETKWCEHTVIILSVLMTVNMIALMCCYRMLLLGKIRQFLDSLVRGAVIEAPGVPDIGSRSHRPSNDSLHYTSPSQRPSSGSLHYTSPSQRPSSGSLYYYPNPGPSTVVINNIGLYSDMVKTPTAAASATAIAGVAEKQLVMLRNPGFSLEESSESTAGGETKSNERERKISVFMDRPLPALPGQSGEREDGMDESRSIERRKKSSTGSVVSNFHKDDGDMCCYSFPSEQKHVGLTSVNKPPKETINNKPGLLIDIESFI